MFNKVAIEKYFADEKSASLFLMILAAVILLAGLMFFFFLKTNFYKGAALPLLLAGLLSGIVGFSVYKRSDADRLKNVYAYDMNPGQLKEKEIPRMEKAMKNFTLVRSAEIILVLLGVGLFVYFKNNDQQLFWRGVGAGLALMALVAFTVDHFAAKRGEAYLNGLKEWVARMK